MDIEWTKHARDMLKERQILEDWVLRVLNHPDDKTRRPDGNMHYVKSIRERNGRVLRVIVNADTQPNRIVTVFFDRRV